MLAERLLSLHIENNPFTKVPHYKYEDLQKGIVCEGCGGFFVKTEQKNCICMDCGHIEKIEAAVLRTTSEIKLLFPKLKITTNIVHEWCQIINTKKMVNRILNKNFSSTGHTRWKHFE